MEGYVFVVRFESGHSQVFSDQFEAQAKLGCLGGDGGRRMEARRAPGLEEIQSGEFQELHNRDADVQSANAVWTAAARAEAGFQ